MVKEFGDTRLEVVYCGPSMAEAYEVGRKILDKTDRPTAVVTLNDLAAIGLMRAAKDLNLSVPEDVSVVGIDGIPLGEQLLVSLSTVAQPSEKMVAQAVEFLIERMEGASDKKSQRVEFATQFIQRESLGIFKGE